MGRGVGLLSFLPYPQLNRKERRKMIEINGEKLPEHISYSALNDYLSCGWMYYLNRIKNEKERPAWWLFGGVLFHKVTEDYDRQRYEKENRA
jgi:hypothetical protein